MANSSVAPDALPPNSNDFDPIPFPPLDTTFFCDLGQSFDCDLDDLDFTFDDLYLPSDTEDFLNSLPVNTDPPPNFDSLLQSPDQILYDDSRVSNPDQISIDRSSDVANFLNVSSSDASRESDNKTSDASRDLNYPSPGLASSQGSGNSVSSVTVVASPNSPNSGNYSRNEFVDQSIKLEEEGNSSLSKRKKESENMDLEQQRCKYRRSNANGSNGISDEDDKRKARLMRNRESAQLSRQRKKQYVEELQDKVRAMHSTIQDLNSRISYIMAENASLRQQVNGLGAMCPPPGMYPHPPMAPMGYPWMQCPPYVVKQQGSQVPLVPIPRLKPQQPAPAAKAKKAESKRGESKTKKVASVSFLGLLFFMLLFGGLVPMVNVKFKEIHESVSGGLNYFNNRYYNQPRGRVLSSINGYLNDSVQDIQIGSLGRSCDRNDDFITAGHCGKVAKWSGERGGANSSEPLVASLYVPRNDKMVKIDGNLIIHSVMASEKAMASTRDGGVKRIEETVLAVAKNMPSIIPLSGRNINSHPYRGPRALSSGAGDKDKLNSQAADGKVQQWFREGLAGPMLSSGMCTEVFQFDVSPTAPAIFPAKVMNMSSKTQHPKDNSTTKLNKGRNRRILHDVSVRLVGSESNITEKHVGVDPEKDNSGENNSLSSMVVSVLVDPREAGFSDGDGMLGPKSLSRIFVVLLIDSVKYVTYSCMLPLVGSSAHLVTT